MSRGFLVPSFFLALAFTVPHATLAEAWWNGFGDPHPVPGMDGEVSCVASVGGSLVAGGSFLTADGMRAERVADLEGNAWSALGSGIGETVSAVIEYDGLLIAGGSGIQFWDGVQWRTFGGGVDGMVFALALWEGDLIAAGAFTSAGGVPVNNIARFNGVSWESLGAGLDDIVACLTVHNGRLVAGGWFDGSGETGLRSIARWDGNGWNPIGNGFYDAILSLTVFNGDLIAGGLISPMYGDPAKAVARWDGSVWLPLGTWQEYGPIVEAVTVHEGSLIAGGLFNEAGDGVRARNIARWDGSIWHPLGAGARGQVRSVCSLGGRLIAGGYIDRAGDVAVGNIAAWDGTEWTGIGTAPQPGNGLDGWVAAFTIYNNTLVAAGQFLHAGVNTADRIARWTGSTWIPAASGIGGNIRALTVYDGSIIAGGEFSIEEGGAANHIARWNPLTSLWMPLGTGMNGNVRALAVWNGELIAGGDFTIAGGVSASRIARWDGDSWSPLADGVYGHPSGDHVRALAVHDGALIVGGQFWNAGTVSVRNIARWDGEQWSRLGSNYFGYEVLCIGTYGPNLVAGGGGYAEIGMWNGSEWSPMPGLSGTGVWAIAECNGSLCVGGRVAPAGDPTSYGVAMWDGSTWSSLGEGLGDPALALCSFGGHLYAGGTFTAAGISASLRIARWEGAPSNVDGDRARFPSSTLVKISNPYHPSAPFWISAENGLRVTDGVVRIFDVSGRLVRVMECEAILRWDGRDARGDPVKDGIFFMSVRIEGRLSAVRHIVLLR